MKLRYIAWNGAVAALYVAISYLLPQFRLGSALYMLAAFDPALIPGLAVGNALSGVTIGPVELIEGAAFGAFTAWLCSKVGPLRSPLVVAVVPTILVMVWLTLVRGLAWQAMLPKVLTGQLIAAAVGAVAILPLGRRLRQQGFLRGAER